MKTLISLLLLTTMCGCASPWYGPQSLNGPFSYWSTGVALGKAQQRSMVRCWDKDGTVKWVAQTRIAQLPPRPIPNGLANINEVMAYNAAYYAMVDTFGQTERALALKENGWLHGIANGVDWSVLVAGVNEVGKAQDWWNGFYGINSGNSDNHSTTATTTTDRSSKKTTTVNVDNVQAGGDISIIINQ